MKRNSEKTRKKILEAVGKLLAVKGFNDIGINAIAREAGVDKVLIYRYFGGMRQLLHAYANQGDFWPKIDELAGKDAETSEADPALISKEILANHFDQLQKRPVTQEIMRWELHEKNELTEELAKMREEQGMALLNLLPSAILENKDLDVAAVAALLHAGISYLILRQKTADVYLGIELNSKEGQERLKNALNALLESYLKSNRLGSKESK